MKKIIFLTLIIASHLFANAQTADDALRYSLTKYNSTARSAAMGGAFGALGGDFSSISINPAGLGVYRSAELTLSSNIRMSNAKNNGFEEEKLSFVIDNLGAVFVFNENTSETGWQGINLAFGYNAMNNFNTRSISRVNNSGNSMTDAWAQEANFDINNLSEFSAGLAKETDLIYIEDSQDFYRSALQDGDVVNQRKFIKEEGYQGEYVFAVGTNYSNKLYLGLSLGVQHIYYKSRSNYSENTLEGVSSTLNNYTYHEFFKNTGDGVNIKLGLIYKPTDNLRLGFAYHSPTYFNMREKYYADIDANYAEDSNNNPAYKITSLSRINEFEYDLRTPSRTILSGAYIFGKRAILSVDYEYVDYSKAKFSEGEFGNIGDREYLDFINKDVKDAFKSTYNLKVGGEYRVDSKISLRAGYALYKSPYEKGFINENSDRKLLSGGVGFRQGNFFLDLAYVNTRFNEYSAYYSVLAENPIDDIISEIVKIKNNFNDFKITFGVKF